MLIEVAPLIGHIPSILYFDFWIHQWPLLIFFFGCGLRWTVAARYALPPARKRNWYIYPGIAQLCRVAYPSASCMSFICVVPMEYPLIASRSGGITVLYRLLALLRVKGYMGNPLTLFKSKFILLIDTIIIAKYYYIVNSLTDPQRMGGPRHPLSHFHLLLQFT